MGDLDRRLAGLRARTGGPFTATQAVAAGFSPAELRRMIRTGTWSRLRRGVYVETELLSAAQKDPARRHALDVAGALLVVGRPAVAGGTSAARILGLDLLAAPPPELVLVTSDRAATGQRRDGYLLRVAALPEHHTDLRFGVRITTAARTVIDLARAGSLTAGVVVADSALHAGLTTQRQVTAVLADCARWRGIEHAQQVAALADRNAESVLESVSRVAMYEQGIPPPRTQVRVVDGGDLVARVDFYWPDLGVVGEADGLAKYEPDGRRTTREIVRAEKRREERLADLGFEVVRWGWELARNPPALALRLRAAFTRASDRRRGRQAS